MLSSVGVPPGWIEYASTPYTINTSTSTNPAHPHHHTKSKGRNEKSLLDHHTHPEQLLPVVYVLRADVLLIFF